MQSFAEQAGVNRGTLSAIINKNTPRKISMRELDLITKGMGMPEGELYSLYSGRMLYPVRTPLAPAEAFSASLRADGEAGLYWRSARNAAGQLVLIGRLFSS